MRITLDVIMYMKREKHLQLHQYTNTNVPPGQCFAVHNMTSLL